MKLLGGEDFERYLGYESGFLGISALTRETLEIPLLLACEDTARRHHHESETGLSSDSVSSGDLRVDFPGSRMMRIIFLLFIG